MARSLLPTAFAITSAAKRIVVDPTIANVKGKEVPVSGATFVCDSRPPIGAEIAFNDAQGARIRLSEGCELSPPGGFERFFLFWPWGDVGAWKVTVYPDGFSSRRPQPSPEKRQGSTVCAAVFATQARIRYFNRDNADGASGLAGRLIRVYRALVTIIGIGAGDELYVGISAVITPFAAFGAPLTAGVASNYKDGRNVDNGGNPDTPAMDCQYVDGPLATLPTSYGAAFNTYQRTQQIDLDEVLKPQQAINVLANKVSTANFPGTGASLAANYSVQTILYWREDV